MKGSGLLVAFAVLACPSGIEAQELRVVLHASEGDPAAPWLAGELESVGFSVELSRLESPLSPSELEALAERASAAAAMQLVSSEYEVVVWVADRLTGKVVVRSVAASGEGGERIVAVRAVELLRASLLEIDRPAPASDGSSDETTATLARPAPQPVRRLLGPSRPPPAEPTPNWFVSAGPGLHFYGGGLTPAGYVLLLGQGRIASTLRGGIILGAPVVGGTVEDEHGNRSRVDGWLIGIELEYSPPWTLAPLAAIGVATAIVVMDGDAQAPYRDQVDVVPSALPYLRLGGRWRISTRFRLRLEAIVGASWPGVVVGFPGADGWYEMARWAAPMIMPTLQLEVAL